VSAEDSGAERRFRGGGRSFRVWGCYLQGRAGARGKSDDTEVIPPVGFSRGAAAPAARRGHGRPARVWLWRRNLLDADPQGPGERGRLGRRRVCPRARLVETIHRPAAAFTSQSTREGACWCTRGRARSPGPRRCRAFRALGVPIVSPWRSHLCLACTSPSCIAFRAGSLSLRPSGHLRCASSAPPGASVVSAQTSGAQRRLRGGRRVFRVGCVVFYQ
jgi:hypothetical protein